MEDTRKKIIEDMLLNNVLRKKIIFVDDVNHSLMTVRNGLKSYYEVYPAPSVARLFEILERVKPDLILLDINMPDMNGYDAITKLKADKRYADIPVIFLTGRSAQESVNKGFRLGAADYVCKPFSITEMVERIDRQINPNTRRKAWQAESIRKTIIYVDDVNYSLLSVKVRLKERYKVYPAESAAVLFETLKRVIPDLILLDINMPQYSGYDIIKKLKADIRYSEIPIIFLTSKSDKESMIKGFSLGAADYVAKPFTDADLIERIEYQVNPETRDCTLINQNEGEEETGKPKILVVDESFSMYSVVKYALSDDYRGPLKDMMHKNFAVYYALRDVYTVFMLSRPDEVEGFLRQQIPDIFLLDHKTLDGDGGLDSLIQIIRGFKEHKVTPIIALTSDGVSVPTSPVGYAGVCDYIEKPFKPEVLRAKLAYFIKRYDRK